MLTLTQINNAAKNSKEFILKEEQKYNNKIKELVNIISKDKNKKIILLAGPSGSGKTTTSSFIVNELKAIGISSKVVSLDNFYGGSHEMPTLEDGRPDFESVYALDIPEIHRCFKEIITNGYTNMPVFDFLKHVRSSSNMTIDIRDGGILIVEGLHALNPIIFETLPQESLFKIYISINDSILNDDGSVLISSRELRLVRRMCRDAVYRNSDAKNTLHLWTAVIKGEEKYLYHFKPTADLKIATLHGYEPCVFKDIYINKLENLPIDSENYETAIKVKEALKKFGHIDVDCVPKGSLLREFI